MVGAGVRPCVSHSFQKLRGRRALIKIAGWQGEGNVKMSQSKPCVIARGASMRDCHYYISEGINFGVEFSKTPCGHISVDAMQWAERHCRFQRYGRAEGKSALGDILNLGFPRLRCR